MRFGSKVAVLAASSLLAGSLAALPGCAASDPHQTKTIVESERSQPASGTLTPLQRGEVRRDVLTAARESRDAWMHNDLQAMRSHFSTDYVSYYTRVFAEYKKNGQVRVRKFKDTFFDVSDLNESGTQALVDWQFTDLSYVADRSGTVITPPSKKNSTIQYTMNKVGGKWIVSRMIGSNEILK